MSTNKTTKDNSKLIAVRVSSLDTSSEISSPSQSLKKSYVVYFAIIVAIILLLACLLLNSTPKKQELFGFMEKEEAEHTCSAFHFDTYPNRTKHRKVYDLFMVNNELDWLEIRIIELADEVDYFVIIESDITFAGNSKKLYVKDNWDRYKKYHHKMILHKLDMTNAKFERSWDREEFTRNAMYDQVFPKLTGDQAPQMRDILIYADLDEIPKPRTIRILRNCDFAKKIVLRSRMYYYSFQCMRIAEDWYAPHATYYDGNDTFKPNDLRSGGAYQEIWNAAWHCSYCLKNLGDIVLKLKSFSHTEFSDEKTTNKKRILDKVRSCSDLFERSNERYAFLGINEDIPQYVKNNSDKFKYMLDRNPNDGNFADFNESFDIP